MARKPSDGPTFLALFAILGLAAGLLGLTALVLPQVMGFAIVLCGFVLLGTLQYLIWGRWISREPYEDDPDADR